MLKVLVVDDEAELRREILLGMDWLAADCVVVGEAADGREGLEAAARFRPNLILTDVVMPGLDGVSMLSELRRRGCRAHGIVLSAHSDFDRVRGALRAGAEDYLLKPFDARELAEAIARVRQREEAQAAPTAGDLLALDKGDKSKYVLQALRYIAEHYEDRDISIARIAGQLNISEGHLSHIFRKETSYTVVAYLTRYRMHMAMELLRDPRRKVYEVAELVGYRDVAYFGSAFKKAVGLSPSEYQDRCR